MTSSRGGEYKGTANVTRGGLACQPWADQSPHSHGYKALVNDSNYCRNPNPDSMYYHPWCFTMDPKKQWDFCDIPSCGNLLIRFSYVSTQQCSQHYFVLICSYFLLWGGKNHHFKTLKETRLTYFVHFAPNLQVQYSLALCKMKQPICDSKNNFWYN